MSYTTTSVPIILRAHGFYTRSEEDQYGTFRVVVDGGGQYSWGVGNGTLLRTNNPNFRAQILKRVDVSAPYSNLRGWVKSANGVFGGARKIGTLNLGVSGSFRDNAFGSANWGISDVDLQNEALIRFKRKLADQESTWQALPFLGESRELTHLVGETNRALFGLFSELVSVKKKFGRRAARWASDAWLYHSFTINPLLSDIKSAASALHRSLSRPYSPARATASAKKAFKVPVSLSKSFGAGCTLEIKADVNAYLEYKYTAGFDVNIRSANSYLLGNQFGFSLGQLPYTLWELTAFSWVADYFSTVGSWLEDLFTSDGGSTRYCTLTRYYKAEGHGTVKPQFGSNYFVASSGDFNSAMQMFLIDRTVLSQLPHVGLRIKTSNQIAVNSLNRLLNLASILVK